MSAPVKNRAIEGPGASNLIGITALMNPLFIKPGVDLVAAEKTAMGQPEPAPAARETSDPVRAYSDELARLAAELNIDLGKLPGGAAPAAKSSASLKTASPKTASPKTASPKTVASAPARVGGIQAAPVVQPLTIGDSDDGSDEECECDEECEEDCDCACHEEECECGDECEDDCDCACHEEECECGDECEEDCD